MSEQTTLPTDDRRDALNAAFDAAEQTTNAPVAQATESDEDRRARDEQGRFARQAELDAKATPAEVVVPDQAAEKRTLKTWKAEHRPLHEKMEAGIPLTPEEAKKVAEYNYQREAEYATGVSVWKDRATRLQSVERAIEPFMPELQKNNISPDVWIKNLGMAHHTLAKGTPEQKLQMFQKLAQDYGIPLGAVQQAQGGQVDPAMLQIIEQFNQLRGQVQGVTSWKEQQEQQRVTSAIAALKNDTEKYPFFEEASGTMAQLLESGLAPDLPTAYAKAVRMDEQLWQKEQARQSQANQSQNKAIQAVANAKRAAISPRSATPSALPSGNTTKDRRALIAEALDAASGRV